MKKLIKRLRNLSTIVFIVAFIFWIFTSIYLSIYNLIYELNLFNLMYGLCGVITLSAFTYKIVPNIFSKNKIGNLNLRVGKSKDKNKTKSGCSSCKKKKK